MAQAPFAVDVGLLDFRGTRELIEAGYEQTLDDFGCSDHGDTACLAEALEVRAPVPRCD